MTSGPKCEVALRVARSQAGLGRNLFTASAMHASLGQTTVSTAPCNDYLARDRHTAESVYCLSLSSQAPGADFTSSTGRNRDARLTEAMRFDGKSGDHLTRQHSYCTYCTVTPKCRRRRSSVPRCIIA
jgi:hypothetical protein